MQDLGKKRELGKGLVQPVSAAKSAAKSLKLLVCSKVIDFTVTLRGDFLRGSVVNCCSDPRFVYVSLQAHVFGAGGHGPKGRVDL